MDTMFLTRATLLVAGAGDPVSEHRLMHSLFSRDGGRDFLFSRDGATHDGLPRYLIASRSEPSSSSIFSLQTRPYAPAIEEGAEFRFELVANPTVSRSHTRADGVRRKGTVDVIMDALHDVPAGQRARAREDAVQTAGFAWLARQGELHGFDVEERDVVISGYEQVHISRDGGKALKQSRLRYAGVLTVTDADAFAQAVANGVGGGRAWGCGMLKIMRQS